MKLFVTGGTGDIGGGIIPALIAEGHHVSALSRTPDGDRKLAALGACPVRGDLRHPAAWVGKAATAEGFIHAAGTFDDDMGAVDAAAMTALGAAVRQTGHRPRLIYTGGGWLYGATGDHIATEADPFDPPDDFAWAVEQGAALLREDWAHVAVIHPALVYFRGGGCLEPLVAPARAGAPVEVWGNPAVRWPLIHRDDLGRAYAALITRRDLIGHFNVVADTKTIAEVTMMIAARIPGCPGTAPLLLDQVAARHGDWAVHFNMDQQMSAARIQGATGWTPQFHDLFVSDIF